MHNFFNIPFDFIKEHLTGWVLLIFIALILYFIILRHYYIRREKFYNQTLEEQQKHTAKSKKKQYIEKFQNNLHNNNLHNNKVNEYVIDTSLFNNIGLTDKQIQTYKLQYNEILSNYIIELGNLIKLSTKNKYLNTQKEFDTIINNGINNMVNYLSKQTSVNVNNDLVPIQNTLTRTTIKNDMTNKLFYVLDTLIDKTNKKLSAQIDLLAQINSTTIDYNTELETINKLRNILEEYINIDKLLTTYLHNVNEYNNKTNIILNKSSILPIYERNFDKIHQLLSSDFNNNEQDITSKYSTTYTHFLEEQKKQNIELNPITLTTQIENGLLSLFTNNNDNNNNTTINKSLDKEVYNKSIPNLGSYLIDKTKNNNEINNEKEEFSNQYKQNTIPNISKTFRNIDTHINNKKNEEKISGNIIVNLFSSNFVQYIMNIISDKLNILVQYYNNTIGINELNIGGIDINNLENNMIPAGFLLFILSMLIYFIDITS